jgi:hypothetical protein
MKSPNAVRINSAIRVFAALAYSLLGIYVVLWSDFPLGEFYGIPIVMLLGILFFIYGLFRLWRAYVYIVEINDQNDENDED